MSSLKKIIEDARQRVRDEYKRLSVRELVLVVVAFGSIGVLVCAWLIGIIQGNFEEQSRAIAELQDSQSEVVDGLTKYLALSKKVSEIENHYKGVEIKEGVRGYLETLIREKAGSSTNYAINAREVSAFGGDFELVPFDISLTGITLQQAVDLLGELVRGKKPLIVSEFQLTKSGERINGSIKVASIRDNHRNESEQTPPKSQEET